MSNLSYSKLKPKPQNIADSKTTVQGICNDLPNETIRKSVLSFCKRLTACTKGKADVLNIHFDKREVNGAKFGRLVTGWLQDPATVWGISSKREDRFHKTDVFIAYTCT